MTSSIFKKMSLFLACLLGVGTTVTAVTLNNQKGNVRVAEATNVTYSINQNEIINCGGWGRTFGIFEVGSIDWDTTLNRFTGRNSSSWMYARHDNLQYVTRVTININVISCSKGTTAPQVWFHSVADYTDRKTLSFGNNTISWNLDWDIDPELVNNVFQFEFALSPSETEFIYFTGVDATTPIISIETSVVLPSAKAYIAAGTGVDSVFLSNSTDGSNPQPSGTKYDAGTNVYAFATLNTEYDPKAEWGSPVSGNTYRVGSITMGSSDYNFGTINAVAKLPTGLTAKYGDELSSVILPDGWSWKTPNDKVGNVGEREHIAIRDNVEYTLTITVTKADPAYVVPTDIEAPYDVALSTIGLPEGFSWMDGSQKTSTWGENTFKAKYTPSDTVNYNVVENIDINVNVKWILVDPTQGDVTVTINDGGEGFDVNISVKIEIKTEVSVDEKKSKYSSLANGYINPDEDIAAIYDVKLIRTIGGVEEEIQPSDIKPGTKVTISMVLPDELVGKDFRLLHIHNSHDVEEISNSKYAISGDGKTIMLQTERLSEFAFVSHTDVPNGFVYTSGLPGWAIALIIVGSILLLCCLCYVLLFFVFNKWIRKDDKALRAVKFGKKDNKVRLLVMPFRFEYREEAEVFDTKQEALKE